MPVEAINRPVSQALLSTYDVVMPDKFDMLMRRYKGQGYEHFFMLKTMGFRLPVAKSTYSWYEEDHIIEYFSTRTDESATGAGNAMTITLATTDVDASNYYFPRVYDSVLFEGSSGDVVGTITAIDVTTPTAPILTVYPNDILKEIPALTAGQKIAIIGNNKAEGSGQPLGRVSKTTEYSNTLAIIAETVDSTGSALNDQLWFKIEQMPTSHVLPGGETWGYYRKAVMDADFRMYSWLSGMMLFGEQITNTSIIDATSSRQIRSTEGLFPYAYTYGNTYNYVTGSLTLQDFDGWDLILEQEFSYGTDVMNYFAIELHQEVENLLKSENQYTGAEWVRRAQNNITDTYFDGSEVHAMSIGFTYLTKSERNFYMKRLRTLSNPQSFGLSDYTKTQLGIILPLGEDKDPVSGQMLPTMGYRYSEQGQYSREYEVWASGAAGGQQWVPYESDTDAVYHYIRGEVGAQFMAGNRFIVVSPS